MRLEAFASWVLVALLSACHAEPQPPAASATQASVEPPTKKTAATQATTLPAPGAALETEFTPDSRRLVILTTEHTIEIFNAEDGERISTIKAPEFVFDVDVSPDGAWIVAAGERGAYVWSAKDFALRQTIRESSETLAFAAEGAYLTTANGGAFYVWELATGKSIARVNDQNEARLNWLHMGRSYLREARAVQFWNIHRGGVALLPWLSTSPSPQGGALIMTDSSTEKTLVTRDLSFESIATLQGRWMLMDRRVLSSQEARHSLLRLNACQTECAEPQDGFSSCQTDCIVEDTLEVRELEKGVTAAALSSNGNYLYIAAKNGTIKCWSSMDKALISTLENHQDTVEIESSADQTKLMSRDVHGIVKV